MIGATDSGREAGFTLVETLVAFAIMASMLALTYGAIQASVHRTTTIRDERLALPVAQSVLARVGGDVALAPGVLDGSTDGQSWRLVISPFEGEVRATDGPPLLDVRVQVHPEARARPVVELHSLRLAQ